MTPRFYQTPKIRARHAASMAAVGAALLMPAAAYGQDEGTDEKWDEDAIIVTATKREATLQDIPVAVTVTSAETIERAQIRDLADLQSIVPSLKVGTRQSSAQTNFFIRGFGNGANNAGIEPSVGVFIDNVYRSRSASQIADLPDVERVEVLRGPQSTLFGKNASAGVVSIVTKQPQFRFGGNVEVSYGNYDAFVFKGMITGPLSDTVAASLSGSYNRRDGTYRNLGTGGRINDRDRWSVRGQVMAEPNDRLSIRIIGDYGKISEQCCAAVNLQQAAPTQVIQLLGGMVNLPDQRFDNIYYSNFGSDNEIDNYGISGQVDYDLGDFRLTSITSWRKSDPFNNQDADFSSLDILQRFSQDLGIDTFTQEVRLTGTIGERISTLLGAYYFNESIRQHSQVQWGTQARPYVDLLVQGGTGGAFTIPLLEQTFGGLEAAAAMDPMLAGKYTGTFFAQGQGLDERYRLKNEAISIFAQADFEITDRLTFSGGLDYTHDKKRFSANVESDDAFASIDINHPAYAPLRNQLLLAGALQAGLPLAQAQAYADANENNPAINPLNQLRPLQFLPPFLDVPNEVEPGRTKDGKLTWTARLSYEATDSITVYAGVSTGFKASSINLSRDSRPPLSARSAIEAAGIGVVNQTYGSRLAGPEKATVYEAGFKGKWDSASANFAIFKQEIKGFQSNIFTGTGFFLANAGKQSVFGFEFEGTVDPVPPLTLGLAVTYLDPKYDSFEISSVGDLTGIPPADIPKWSITLSADYIHDLANDDRVLLHVDFHYEDKTQQVEGLPAFIVQDPITGEVLDYQPALDAAAQFSREIENLNASLTYAMDSGLEFTVWGRNLLNDRHIEMIFDSPAQIGSISGYPNQPRTYGVAARYRW